MTIKTWKERIVDAGHAASTDGMRINKHAQSEIDELRAALDAALKDRDALAIQYMALADAMGYDSGGDGMVSPEEFATSMKARLDALAQPVQPALSDIEQYRLQMAAISTAALGYWKAGDAIHPDYCSVALNDVADLYKKYDELYQKPVQPEPFAWYSAKEDDFMLDTIMAEHVRLGSHTHIWGEYNVPLYTGPVQQKEPS